MDRSHEWLFAYDDLAEMLTPLGFDVFLSDRSLETITNLSAHKLVMLMDGATHSAFSKAEQDLLIKYAGQGGQLLVITKAGVPVESLASALGFALKPGGAGPLFGASALQVCGCPRQMSNRPVNQHLVPPGKGLVLVTDAKGNAVAASLAYGQGRAVVWADDGSCWDFCAYRTSPGKVGSAATAPAITALFKWMTGGRLSGQRGQVLAVEAEMTERQGSLLVRYSKPVGAAARSWTAKLPAIADLVEKCNGQAIPAEPSYTVHFLAGGGGGWAGPRACGVCVYGGTFPLRVFGHELTHSIANPLPRVFGEAWATVVGLRVGEEQGGAEDARTEYKSLMRRLDQVDPQRNAIDLMKSDVGPCSQDQYTKAVWLLMECQRRYGDGFMPRVLELRDQRFGIRKPVSLSQLFRLFDQASGDPKSHEWFRFVGTSGLSAP